MEKRKMAFLLPTTDSIQDERDSPNRSNGSTSFISSISHRSPLIFVILIFIVFMLTINELDIMIGFAPGFSGAKLISLDNPLVYQNRQVGHIHRLCASNEKQAEEDLHSCLIMHQEPSSEEGDCDYRNIDDPDVEPAPYWLKNRRGNYYMYYSSHKADSDAVTPQALKFAFADSPEGPWTVVSDPSEFVFAPAEVNCESFHSPDAVFDSSRQLAFLYVHAHNCVDASGATIKGQPSFVLVSEDGLNWSSPSDEETMVAKELFYMRLFRYENDDYYYAVAKDQVGDGGIGHMVIARSTSPYGPFIVGPTLARGVRHCSVDVVDSTAFFFCTLITDVPERVVLLTVDMSVSEDYEEWVLSPGPTLLEPKWPYETGNADAVTSHFGTAGCNSVKELRDPHFMRTNLDLNSGVLEGMLFYSVKGEGGFAIAKMSLDLVSFFATQRFKDQSNIHPLVLRTSSLHHPVGSPQTPGIKIKPSLITGTGRSGTTYICKLFNAVGVRISHDNDDDCGQFPGGLGAASWYHAFKHHHMSQFNATDFEHVLHLVREPLSVIKSRAKKSSGGSGAWLEKLTGLYEDSTLLDTTSEIALCQWSLRHWVRRNSFVSQHAEYIAQIEDVSNDPLHAWMLCIASGGGGDCPELEKWREAEGIISTHTNTGGEHQSNENFNFDKTWEELAVVSDEDRDYVRIALKMGEEWGYPPETRHVVDFGLDGLEYKCDFENTAEAMLNGEDGHLWDCRVAKG